MKKKPVAYLVKGCYQQGEFFYVVVVVVVIIIVIDAVFASFCFIDYIIIKITQKQ